MKTDRTTIKRWARWLATCIGFPIAGVAARLAVGNIDSREAAVIGGLVGGAVLGVIQATIGGIAREDRVRWIAATACGFAVGLGVGSDVVGFRTDPASLALMGVISGAAVGIAQAVSIPMRSRDRVAWALVTPVLWAGGWLVSSQVIVDADRQHAIFGGPAAITVSALAGVLHIARRRSSQPATRVAGSISSAVL